MLPNSNRMNTIPRAPRRSILRLWLQPYLSWRRLRRFRSQRLAPGMSATYGGILFKVEALDSRECLVGLLSYEAPAGAEPFWVRAESTEIHPA